MTLELNRATFRRLVQLYLAALVFVIAAFVVEQLTTRWWAFGEEFERLVDRHFGSGIFSADAIAAPLLLLLALFVWNIAATIGLLWFKRWARFGVWGSVIAIMAGMLMMDGYRPAYTSPLLDAFTLLDGGLLGAILLMAYAKELGANWFREPAPDNKD